MKKWLLLILVVAALFRFIGLTQSPPALNWDEVSIGYNAYSILKTGRDEWGKFMPLSFKAFGEEKLPGMIYASIPGVALFGETDFGVRVTPAVIGLLSVVALYFLGAELLGKRSYGLVAAGLLAISPWGVLFSRASFEAGLAMLFTILSVYFLVRSQKNAIYLWPAMGTAVLGAYTYNSVRILLPLMVVAYLVLDVIKLGKAKKTAIAVCVVGVLLALPIALELASPAGRVRLGTVAITTQKGFYDSVSESRGYMLPFLGDSVSTLIQNKYTHYVHTFFMNYVETFSTEFLFLKGSANTERSVQGIGLLYLFELPLLIAGFFALKKQKPMVAKVLLPWLLLAPIPSAITTDAPSSVRALGLLPALLLIESVGFGALVPWFRSRRVAAVLAIIFVVWDIGYFSYKLWMEYPVKYSTDWLYGYKQAVAFAGSHYQSASHIYMTSSYGEPYIYVLFYTHYDPAKYQKGPVQRETDPTGWVHVDGFDKYVFTSFGGLQSPTELVARHAGKLVMIDGFATLPGDMHRDFVVQAPNWKVVFEGTVQQGLLQQE